MNAAYICSDLVFGRGAQIVEAGSRGLQIEFVALEEAEIGLGWVRWTLNLGD
jgi:hypothetical protein